MSRLAAWGCLAVLVSSAAACQPASSTAIATPSPTMATESPSAVASASPSPSPAATATPATAAACRFPVASPDSAGNLNLYFLDVPTGSKTSPKWVAQQHGVLLQTVDKPVLLGRTNGFGFYDRAFNRWIPAEVGAVSPDGTHYAYASGATAGPNELHIVDVRTGVDRLAVYGGKYYPLDYSANGIYLSERNGGSGLVAGSGLFLLDLHTNAIRQLHNSTRTEFWSLIYGGFAYGSDINPADPNPQGLGEASNELVRLNLATGAMVRFQFHPGTAVYVLGITPAGQLLADVGAGPQIIDGAGAAKSIPGMPANAYAFVDSRHTWLLTGDPASAVGDTRNASLFVVSNGRAVHQMDFQWGTNDTLIGACR